MAATLQGGIVIVTSDWLKCLGDWQLGDWTYGHGVVFFDSSVVKLMLLVTQGVVGLLVALVDAEI